MKYKKWSVFVFTLLLILHCFIFVEAASRKATGVTFDLESTEYEVGDTVEVSVSLSGVDKACLVVLHSGTYDRQYLKYIGAEMGDVKFSHMDAEGIGDNGDEQISVFKMNLLFKMTDVDLDDGDTVVRLKYKVLKPIKTKFTLEYAVFAKSSSNMDDTIEPDCVTPAEFMPPHIHDWDSHYSKNNTYHWYECSDCDEVKNKSAHTMDKGVVTKPATETTTGICTYTCTACGHTKTETIPAEGIFGTCGRGLTWELKNGILTISGSGAMTNFDSAGETAAPWSEDRLKITKVIIGKDVTSVGDFAFFRCENLTAVEFETGSKLTSMGDYTFRQCTALKTVYIPDGVTKLGTSILYGAKQAVLQVVKNSYAHAYADENGYLTELRREPLSLQIPGDINGDYLVDLLDSLLLFQHTMMPDLFPIGYKGSLDFNKDGYVDLTDVLHLFQHSMMPDLFPI